MAFTTIRFRGGPGAPVRFTLQAPKSEGSRVPLCAVGGGHAVFTRRCCAALTGFEPATHGSGSRCSVR